MTTTAVREDRETRGIGLYVVGIVGAAQVASIALGLSAPFQPLLSILFVLTCPGFLLFDLDKPSDVSARLLISIGGSLGVNIAIATVVLVAEARWIAPLVALVLVAIAALPKERLRDAVSRIGSLTGATTKPLALPAGEPEAGAADSLAGGDEAADETPIDDLADGEDRHDFEADAADAAAVSLAAAATETPAEETPSAVAEATLEATDDAAAEELEETPDASDTAAELEAEADTAAEDEDTEPAEPGAEATAQDDAAAESLDAEAERPVEPDIEDTEIDSPVAEDVVPGPAPLEVPVLDVETDAPALLDINTANETELMALPGVGPLLAVRIVSSRMQYGPFESFDDLLRVPGIGPSKMRVLPELATVSPLAELPDWEEPPRDDAPESDEAEATAEVIELAAEPEANEIAVDMDEIAVEVDEADETTTETVEPSAEDEAADAEAALAPADDETPPVEGAKQLALDDGALADLAAGSILPSPEAIEVNHATARELTALPGVGPALAERIVRYRESHGSFVTHTDLEGVSGLSTARVADLAELVRFTHGLVDLNRATAVELQAVQGLGPELADRIVAYRDAHGPFGVVDDLTGVSGVGPASLEAMRSQIVV